MLSRDIARFKLPAAPSRGARRPGRPMRPVRSDRGAQCSGSFLGPESAPEHSGEKAALRAPVIFGRLGEGRRLAALFRKRLTRRASMRWFGCGIGKVPGAGFGRLREGGRRLDRRQSGLSVPLGTAASSGGRRHRCVRSRYRGLESPGRTGNLRLGLRTGFSPSDPAEVPCGRHGGGGGIRVCD